MSNPILIELTRGGLVESMHRGALAIARSDGSLVASAGDVRRPVFPRSAIKAFQCLPMIELGAADHYRFGAAEIALACASHSGSERHVAVASGMLARAGQTAAALGCGSHAPDGVAELEGFLRSGSTATALHNNCSGKHAGMVCLACHRGEPVAGYLAIDHPVQRRIMQVYEDMTGHAIGRDEIGIDGCSAPNFAAPLANLAQAFARFVTGDSLAASRRAACEKIAASCWAEPELVAGSNRVDTLVMQAFAHRAFVKSGAEGVYCGALPEHGLGLALKIDDGSKRASVAVLLDVLERVLPGARAAARVNGDIVNRRGTVVGATRAAPALQQALDTLHA